MGALRRELTPGGAKRGSQPTEAWGRLAARSPLAPWDQGPCAHPGPLVLLCSRAPWLPPAAESGEKWDLLSGRVNCFTWEHEGWGLQAAAAGEGGMVLTAQALLWASRGVTASF